MPGTFRSESRNVDTPCSCSTNCGTTVIDCGVSVNDSVNRVSGIAACAVTDTSAAACNPTTSVVAPSSRYDNPVPTNSLPNASPEGSSPETPGDWTPAT